MTTPMTPPMTPYEAWSVTKPMVSSSRGVVAAQNVEAAEVGARVLADGGNAVDAAIATALALAVAEPWMSGLGGGGYMTVYVAKEKRVRVVDFGMIASRHLDPADFPLGEGESLDLFGWPAVQGDVNAHGPKSVTIPGSVAGYALALEAFGSKSWAELSAPAIALAERGHRITWWTTLQTAADAALLGRYPTSAAVWLPGGLPPVMGLGTGHEYLAMGKLAATLRHLSDNGPRAFYEGELATALTEDIRLAGGYLSMGDLAGYRAAIVDPATITRGAATYHVPPGLTAGPTFVDALTRLPAAGTKAPDAAAFAGYAKALIEAYRHRFETMGHAGDFAGDRSCTTHLSAIDADGNLVSLTTTLLSRFGSRFVSPSTGVLMNNGVYWFDPRPGRPNSLAPGVKPLSNMVPTVATRDGAPWFGFGASGGRKILPAVLQLCSFVADYGMTLDQALAHPRLEPSEVSRVICDERLTDEVLAAVGAVAPVVPWPHLAFPGQYATPCGVMMDGATCLGAATPFGPLTAAVAA